MQHEPTSKTWCPSGRRTGSLVPRSSSPENSGVSKLRSRSLSVNRRNRQQQQKTTKSHEPSAFEPSAVPLDTLTSNPGDAAAGPPPQVGKTSPLKRSQSVNKQGYGESF